jgi:hypothetical protein
MVLIFVVGNLSLVVVLPVDEDLVGDERIVIFLWDLEVSQELEVFQGSETLVLVEFDGQ